MSDIYAIFIVMRKNFNRKQIITISLISLMLAVTAVGLDVCLENGLFTSADTLSTPSTVSTASAVETTGYIYSEKLGSKLTEIEDEPYVEGPDVLNLAYYYPEGADTSDVMNSFAGMAYSELAIKDADYFSTIYDMGDRDPLSFARELGYDSSKVMGKYNPTVASQDSDNPATWSVERFKNVNVSFYDGDGNRINGYSNVKEILSMASIYSYYHDMTDAESMKAYANDLWNRSHSYKVSIGDVYYCSGCLNKTIQEEAMEAIEQERKQLQMEQSLASNTAASSGDPAMTENAVPDFTIEELENGTEAPKILYAPASTENRESSFAQTGSQSASDSASSGEQGSGVSVQTSTTQSSETTAAETTEAQTQTSDSEVSPTIELQAVSLNEDISGLSYDGIPLERLLVASNDLDFSIEDMGNSATSETEATSPTSEGTSGTLEQSAVQSSEASGTSVHESVDTIIDPGLVPDNGPGILGASSQKLPGESAYASEGQSTEGSGALESTAADGLIPASDIVGSCPGHVDLNITVTLYGIDDANGLMSADAIGNDKANYNDKWQGWTEEAKEAARSLNGADWFKRYGITISAINVRNPLSESEINAYLDRMPADTSQQRKDIVSFALHSVGKVPYYWGGKPSGSGYESNNFGALMVPDTRGRVLRGLDCSGWINWVYWSVLGSPLPGESTGTLIGCGERIARSELKPGDIIVRIGADAHVIMFIEWADNGNMVVVHETGGAINNVTVSEMSANWPYYRRLVTE